MAQVDAILNEYMSRPEFIQHKHEANQVHKELIGGRVGPILELFLKDSLIDTLNLQNINDALASEQFRQHSARIDTQVVVGTDPAKFTTHIAFRDIFYLGNNKFKRFGLSISFLWDDKFKTVRRQVSFGSREINSRVKWDNKIWWNWQELFKEK